MANSTSPTSSLDTLGAAIAERIMREAANVIAAQPWRKSVDLDRLCDELKAESARAIGALLDNAGEAASVSGKLAEASLAIDCKLIAVRAIKNAGYPLA